MTLVVALQMRGRGSQARLVSLRHAEQLGASVPAWASDFIIAIAPANLERIDPPIQRIILSQTRSQIALAIRAIAQKLEQVA